MDFTEKNQLAIKKYEALVLQTYSEPVEGKFEDATAAILERLRSDDEESGTDSDMDMEFEA